jgi:hypothetical protein
VAHRCPALAAPPTLGSPRTIPARATPRGRRSGLHAAGDAQYPAVNRGAIVDEKGGQLRRARWPGTRTAPGVFRGRCPDPNLKMISR